MTTNRHLRAVGRGLLYGTGIAVGVYAAPAIVFAALCGVDFQRSVVIRAIFKGRELALGSEPDDGLRPHGLLAFTKSIGWGVLAEEPGREIVMGGVG